MSATTTSQSPASSANAPLFIANLQEQMKHPDQDYSLEMLVIFVILLIVCWLLLALRITTRVKQATKLRRDDYMAILSSSSITAVIAILLRGHRNGIGRHLVFLGLENALKAGFYLYLAQPVFIIAATFTKLTFVLHLCTAQSFGQGNTTKYKWTCRVLVAAWTAHGIISTFLLIFQCYPLSLAWTTDRTRQCLDTQAILIASGAVSVILNIITLALSIPLALKVAQGLKQIIALSLAYTVGIGAIAFSILRVLQTRTYNRDTPDATYGQAKVALYGIIEIGLVFICSCLIVIFPLGTQIISNRGSRESGESHLLKQPVDSSYIKRSQSTEPMRERRETPSPDGMRSITSGDDNVDMTQSMKITSTVEITSHVKPNGNAYRAPASWSTPKS